VEHEDRRDLSIDALLREGRREVPAVLHNLKVHDSRLVKKWLGKHRKEIKLLFLPRSLGPESGRAPDCGCETRGSLASDCNESVDTSKTRPSAIPAFSIKLSGQ